MEQEKQDALYLTLAAFILGLIFGPKLDRTLDEAIFRYKAKGNVESQLTDTRGFQVTKDYSRVFNSTVQEAEVWVTAIAPGDTVVRDIMYLCKQTPPDQWPTCHTQDSTVNTAWLPFNSTR